MASQTEAELLLRSREVEVKELEVLTKEKDSEASRAAKNKEFEIEARRVALEEKRLGFEMEREAALSKERAAHYTRVEAGLERTLEAGSLTSVIAVRGPPGAPGAKGEPGQPGERGLPGPPGADGKDGKNGKDGDRGPIGPRGERGLDGLPGIDGEHGRDGATGPRGPAGINWRGAFSRGFVYSPGDAVENLGSSWIATRNTKDEPNEAAADWDLLAKRGADGFGVGYSLDGGGGGGGASDAVDLAFTPAGTIASENVQDAIEELEGDLVGLAADVVALSGTTAPLTLHVETSGNDTTGDGSIDAPFATPAGAVEYVRSISGGHVRHQVDVLIGVGNFPGFLVQGFTFEPANPALGCGFRFIGTLISASLTTGNNTGTFSAVTTGNATSDVVFSTVTDSGNSLTSDNLKGKLLEFLTGTSALSIVPPTTNSGTVITLPGIAAFGSVGGTYAIRDFGTVISTAIRVGASIPAHNAASQTPVPIWACCAIQGNYGGPSDLTQIRVECLKFSPTNISNAGTGGLFIKDNPVTVNRCFMSDGGAATGRPLVVISSPRGSTTFTDCIINPTVSGSATGLSVTGAGTVTLSRCLFSSLAAVSPFSMVTSTAGYVELFITSCQLDRTGFGLNIGGAIQRLSLTASRVVSAGNQGVRYRPNQDGAGGCGTLSLTSSAFHSCATALDVQGRVNVFGSALHGASNTTAMNFTRGASVQFGSTSTLTGTTELSLDGNVTTFAAMRALSPKLLTTSYLTSFFE